MELHRTENIMKSATVNMDPEFCLTACLPNPPAGEAGGPTLQRRQSSWFLPARHSFSDGGAIGFKSLSIEYSISKK
jgi:hypothetical protein